MSGVRGTIRHSVGAVISETRSYSPLSWRIDTGVWEEVPTSILENDKNRNMIISWAKSQHHSVYEECIPAYPASSFIFGCSNYY